MKHNLLHYTVIEVAHLRTNFLIWKFISIPVSIKYYEEERNQYSIRETTCGCDTANYAENEYVKFLGIIILY